MMDAPALIHILTDAGSPEFQKAKACQRVGELGAKEAVPALARCISRQTFEKVGKALKRNRGDAGARTRELRRDRFTFRPRQIIDLPVVSAA